MKYIVYLLSVGALVGYAYDIAPGISWADLAWISLLVISLRKYFSKEWIFDTFSRYSAIFVPVMLVAALINFEVSNTTFINFFRNYTSGVVVYFALSNTIKDLNDLKKLVAILAIFLVQFVLNYRRMMQDTYSETMATLDFGYGRNNVAFTALLFAILFEFLYYSKIAKSYILLGIVVMGSIITLCASRYAMMMLAISYVLYRIMSGKKFSPGEIISLLIVLIGAPIIMNFMNGYVDSSFMDYSQNLLNDKLNNAEDDFYYSRIIGINVEPISDFLDDKGILGLLFGDGISIQHSFFSHALCTTGIFGLYIFVKYMIQLFKWAYGFKGEGFFLFIMIMAMYMNDFITNARFIIGVNSVFFCIICAIIYKYIQFSNYENAHISK